MHSYVFVLLSALLLWGAPSGVWAQPNASSTALATGPATARTGALFDALAQRDHELFDAAFVRCDAPRFRALFTEDAEFYHDRTGLASGEAARTMRSCPRDQGVTRTLVPGSLEVYPLQGWGAIQMGRHRFSRAGELGSEEAQFVHVWKQEQETWRLARVLSFDHRPAPTPRSAASLVGRWQVDLRPTPQSAPYFQELVVTRVHPNLTFEGTFYGAPIAEGRINADWGALRLAFVTGDASGAYHHSAVWRGDTLEGLTHSTGRGFLSVWSAVQPKEGSPP